MYSCCGSILVPCYGCHKQPPPLLATTVTTSQPQIEPPDSVYHQHRHHQTCSTTVSLLTTTTSARRSAGVGVTRRRLYALTAMASGMVLILVYTVSFSCCVLVHSGLVGRADPDEVVYQQDLEHNMSPSSSGSSLYYGTGGGGGARPVHLPVVSQHPDNEPYDLDSSSQENPIQSSSSRRHHHPVSTSLRAGNKNLPDAIIIGVKKAGTRALLEFLRVHPDVRAPGPEPHFFDRNYDLGFDWYRSQMPSTIEGQLTIEKTPSYFVTKEVPGRIYDMNRNTKLILVVRNPVTRAISDYAQALAKRPDTKSFEEMAFIDNSTGLVDTSWGAIKIGVYARHLERWLKYFPLSQIHFVNGEKLISSPANEMGKVQDFLGLKRVITDKHFFFNTTKGFPCLKKPENSGNPHCLGKTKGRPHPEVSPQVLKRLSDFFRPFNQKFYQMTNHDFGWL